MDIGRKLHGSPDFGIATMFEVFHKRGEHPFFIKSSVTEAAILGATNFSTLAGPVDFLISSETSRW